MPWVKLDDQFPDHPKVVAAGGDAAWLYVAALCYCQAKLTDGHIPTAMVPRLTDRKAPMALAAKLVEVVLWEPAEGGYMIHDYFAHNAPSEKVKAKREATRRRVTEWRERHAGNGVTSESGNADRNGVTAALVTPPPTANRLPDQETHPARTRAIPRHTLGATWQERAGNLATDGLLELADLAERSAATVDEEPGIIFARAVDEYKAYRATCSPGRVPSLTPRKLIERWADVWERMYPTPDKPALVIAPADPPGPRRSFL